MIGLAPVVLRAASEGRLGRALVVAVAVAAGLWLAPTRWKAAGGFAAATAVGVALLHPALGVTMGVFVAAGIALTGRAGGEPVAREARLAVAIGLTAGSLILLVSPLVSIPTAIVAGAIVAAVVIQTFRPVRLQQLGDTLSIVVADRARPVVSATRARFDALSIRWKARTASSGRALFALCAIGAAVGVLLGVRDQRYVLIDDAAITFRYAARIASGDGFTYNDGDRTNGASAPLYTLVLALGHRIGWDVEAVARAIGVVAYAATAALVTAIAGRCRGVAAGAVAGFVLLTSSSFRAEALTGMESVVAAMLGMLVILLVVEGRLVWAGVVLGLAIVNKVDAGFLALAVGSTWLLVHRRPPWRLAAVAAVTAAPWFIFSQLYFGSVVPFSATQKIGQEVANPDNSLDPLWILRRIGSDQTIVLFLGCVVLALALSLRLVRLETKTYVTVVSCGLWVVLHGAAFSLIDLGDPYPWYTTVLFPPLITGGVLAVFVVAERLSAAAAESRRSGLSPRALTRGVTGALVVLVLVNLEPGIDAAVRVALEGRELTDYEQFEETRRLGGQYAGEHAEPGEVVQTCYGWVAFGALQNPILETCPLSTRDDPGPPTWVVESYQPDQQRPIPQPEYVLVRSFRSPHGDTFVYRVSR